MSLDPSSEVYLYFYLSEFIGYNYDSLYEFYIYIELIAMVSVLLYLRLHQVFYNKLSLTGKF